MREAEDVVGLPQKICRICGEDRQMVNNLRHPQPPDAHDRQNAGPHRPEDPGCAAAGRPHHQPGPGRTGRALAQRLPGPRTHAGGQGLIRGYRAHVAVDRIRSATVVLAQVSFKQHALEEFTEFDRRILAMPEVVEACRISGAYDYLLRVIVNDVHHWKDIARLLLGGDYGVEKIVSYFLMDEVKPFSGYPLVEAATTRRGARG